MHNVQTFDWFKSWDAGMLKMWIVIRLKMDGVWIFKHCIVWSLNGGSIMLPRTVTQIMLANL